MIKKEWLQVPNVIWVYSILSMGQGISFTIYSRETMRLVEDAKGPLHFPTLDAAIAHAGALAKRKYIFPDLVAGKPFIFTEPSK